MDTKIAYGASLAFTKTLASLASDTSLLAGRETSIIDNSSNEYLDYLVGGKIKVASSGLTTGRVIEVWAYAALNDTPIYPDQITGSDSNRSWTTRDVLAGGGRLVAAIPTTNTASIVYPFGPVSIASLFGGVCPAKFGLWIVHSTGNALDSTEGSHVLSATPIYATAN